MAGPTEHFVSSVYIGKQFYAPRLVFWASQMWREMAWQTRPILTWRRTTSVRWYWDVPQVSGGIETQQSVLDGHFVERGSFLVAEERVRDPNAIPAVVAEPKQSRSADDRSEDKSRVSPRLTQVHTHRVVLQYSRPLGSGQSTSGPVVLTINSVWMTLAGYAAVLQSVCYIHA